MPLNKFIVSGSKDRKIKIWNYETGECISTLKGHTNSVISVAIIPGLSQIVSGSGDKKIKIWNFGEGKTRRLISFDY